MYCDLRYCFAYAEVILHLAPNERCHELHVCSEHFKAMMSCVQDADVHAEAV